MLRALLALVAAAAIGAATAQAQQSRQLDIATGGTGGVYYVLGGGFGSILGKELPGVTATARVTGGSVANLQLVGSGKADICFTQVDAAWDAINGLDKFASGKLPIRALAVMYVNYMHVVTVEGTGINKFEDLKGKRVSTGSPGSATEVFALRLIEAAGLDKDKDMRRDRLGVAESANAIKDRKIDAFFFVVGLPTSSITDLANTPNTKIKLLDHGQYLDKMLAKYPNLYAPGTIPKATYAGHGGRCQRRHGLEHHGGACQDGRPAGLRPDQDHAGEAGRSGAGAQGGAQHQAGVADLQPRRHPLASRRAQVLQGEGHQGGVGWDGLGSRGSA